jgi:hypothetical protein
MKNMFQIHTTSRSFNYIKQSNVYARFFSPNEIFATTVTENKGKFTSTEVKQADIAREVMKRIVHESSSSAIQIAKRGTILNLRFTKGFYQCR